MLSRIARRGVDHEDHCLEAQADAISANGALQEFNEISMYV
jgi:hypothetical protein